MPCVKCGRPFVMGQVMYENSGKSPLCYSCAEEGSLVGVCIVAFILFFPALIGIIAYRCSDKYRAEKLQHQAIVKMLEDFKK